MARRHPADAPRRARLRLQVEHGLDARLAGLPGPRAGAPPVPPPRDDLLDGVRLQRELRAADLATTRSCTARARWCARCPGDRWQQLANLRALPRLHVGAPRQAAALHGLGVRPGGRVVARPRSLDWWLLDHARPPRGAAAWSGTSTAVYRETPRCGAATTTRTASRWIDANDAGGNTFSFLRCGRRRRRAGLHRELLRPSRTTATGSGCRSPGAGTRCSTPTPTSTRGSGRRQLRRPSRRTDESWHGRPASARLDVPPLGTVWLRPAR